MLMLMNQHPNAEFVKVLFRTRPQLFHFGLYFSRLSVSRAVPDVNLINASFRTLTSTRSTPDSPTVCTSLSIKQET